MKSCYACNRDVQEKDALRNAHAMDAADDGSVVCDALGLVHCSGPEEVFVEQNDMDVPVVCNECLLNALAEVGEKAGN